MLITVHRELNLLTAHTVRGLLVSEGIAATLFSEHMIALAWSKSLAYGEVQIQVPSIQADQARAVLEALLDKYADAGLKSFESLDILKVDPLSAFGTPMEIINLFGSKANYLTALHQLEAELYLEEA